MESSTEHGGTIRVRNIPTRGASFTIELPFQTTASMPTFAPAQATVTGRRGRILLVDQDDSVLEAVERFCAGAIIEFQTARDGREARALLERQDLISSSQICKFLMSQTKTTWKVG